MRGGLGAERTGAALAGVSFALCGFMIGWLGHPQTNAACLLPALFWTLGRASGRAVFSLLGFRSRSSSALILLGRPSLRRRFIF